MKERHGWTTVTRAGASKGTQFALRWFVTGLVVLARSGKTAATNANVTIMATPRARSWLAQKTKSALPVIAGRKIATRAGADPITRSRALPWLVPSALPEIYGKKSLAPPAGAASIARNCALGCPAPESPTPVDDANSES